MNTTSLTLRKPGTWDSFISIPSADIRVFMLVRWSRQVYAVFQKKNLQNIGNHRIRTIVNKVNSSTNSTNDWISLFDFRRFWTGNKTEDQFCINCCKYHKSSNIFHLSFLKVLWSSHFKIKSNWHDYSTNSILSTVNFYIHLMCLSLILHSYNTNRHVTWFLYYTILGVTAISKKF